MGNELTTRQQNDIIQDFDDVVRIGKAMARSGYFSDAQDAAKAIVKILAGREMGFGPFVSMNGVQVIKGKPTIGANLMASAVRSHPEYDYRIKMLTDTECALAFIRNGEVLGESTFSIEEARKAGVGSLRPPGRPGTMLEMYPKNMLFARAMSNGVRWYCPDVFSGNAVYTPEELDADADVVDGDVADVTEEPPVESALEIEQKDTQEPEEPEEHWIDDDNIRKRFWVYTKDTLALSEKEVYEALGVEHIHDFDGTMQDARSKLDSWVGDQSDEDSDRLDIDVRPRKDEPEPDTDNELIKAAIEGDEDKLRF